MLTYLLCLTFSHILPTDSCVGKNICGKIQKKGLSKTDNDMGGRYLNPLMNLSNLTLTL